VARRNGAASATDVAVHRGPKGTPRERPSSRSQNTTQVARHNRRSLDEIAEEIHDLDRRNVFAIGKLLAEARKGAPGEHGKWQDWLDQFDFGYRTALNYLAAYDLAVKCESVAYLKVPASVIYDLADDLDRGDISEGDLKVIIKALDKASKSASKPLTVADCNRVIDLATARLKWGDLPEATLRALHDVAPFEASEWAAAAIKVLKKARPTTDEAAKKIVLEHRETMHRRSLPPLPSGLHRPTDSLDRKSLREMGYSVRAEAPPNAELIEAIRIVVRYARQPMPTSIGISGTDLAEAVHFLDSLHKFATTSSAAQRAADRAEARSKRGGIA
jgi:hypothetical protein